MKIFVGCSSKDNLDSKYIKEAQKLGILIGKYHHCLIFGSAYCGLMGEVYRSTIDNGGEVIAVIPRENRGVLTEVRNAKNILVDSLVEQLKYLVEEGDITIILPGGYGTLAELITSIQCKKLGEHHKMIYIVNTDGYYNDMLHMIDKAYEENFDDYDRTKLYTVINEVEELERVFGTI